MSPVLSRVAVLSLLGVGSSVARDVGAFDHADFDGLLKTHVVKGMVDYDAFRKAPEFPRYLASLAAYDPTLLPEADRLAFWINAYNAYTIQLINAKNERESIRNINKSFGLKLKGPWKEEIAGVGGKKYSLDGIEHEIIRKKFKEPRIHFALVCAAMGCPPLRSEAYTGAALDAQLADQSKLFLIETPLKNRVDVKAGVVYGSMIYVKYYREDFGGTDAAIGRFLAGFRPDGVEKQLLLSGKFKLLETDYDWTLNSQEKAKALAAGAKK